MTAGGHTPHELEDEPKSTPASRRRDREMRLEDIRVECRKELTEAQGMCLLIELGVLLGEILDQK